jgi:hypothetical protein
MTTPHAGISGMLNDLVKDRKIVEVQATDGTMPNRW